MDTASCTARTRSPHSQNPWAPRRSARGLPAVAPSLTAPVSSMRLSVPSRMRLSSMAALPASTRVPETAAFWAGAISAVTLQCLRSGPCSACPPEWLTLPPVGLTQSDTPSHCPAPRNLNMSGATADLSLSAAPPHLPVPAGQEIQMLHTPLQTWPYQLLILILSSLRPDGGEP